MKLEKGYHFLIIFLWPSTVCKYGTGKTGRTSSLGLNCGTGNGWNRLWNRGAPSACPFPRPLTDYNMNHSLGQQDG